MKKMLHFSLVLSVLALLACEDDESSRGSRRCEPNCPPPTVSPIIYSMFPTSGTSGDEVTLLIDNFPASAIYDGVPAVPNGTHAQQGPYVSAYVGSETAEILSASTQTVVIRIPAFLDPGDYRISLNINGHTVSSETLFAVTKPVPAL